MSINFFVPGIPVAKGSAKAFVVKGRAIVTQSNGAKQKPWASAISYTAQQAGVRPYVGPVLVSMTFVMPRPKNHYRANGKLKDTAPLFHVSKPDVDKLVRLVFDALTGIAWKDDSQAQIKVAEKLYADDTYTATSYGQPGVKIGIYQIGYEL
jgi:crossover junction endodeoxyribonuclease RusA